MLKKHSPFLIALVLLVNACDIASAKPVTVTSYKKNFTVTAATHELANSIASDSEEARKYVLEKLAWQQTWRNPLEIIVAGPESRFRRKIVFTGDEMRYSIMVPEAGEYFLDTIIPEIIRFTIISRSQVRRAASIDQIYGRIPYWLIKGVVYYIDPRREAVYANEARGALFAGTFVPVGRLFAAEGRRKDAARDHALGYESAALIDCLLNLERGKERFETFVSSLNDTEGWKCVFEDIYWSDFKNDRELNDAFMQSLRSVNRISMNMPRMTAADSLVLLNDALFVKARRAGGAAQEAAGVSELAGFAPCCRYEIARRKLMQAYPALIKVKFEGATELQTVVEKYLQAYILSGDRDKKKFWNAFVAAENARKKIEQDVPSPLRGKGEKRQ
jgi:hypothetical protein